LVFGFGLVLRTTTFFVLDGSSASTRYLAKSSPINSPVVLVLLLVLFFRLLQKAGGVQKPKVKPLLFLKVGTPTPTPTPTPSLSQSLSLPPNAGKRLATAQQNQANVS
jgi:hypothetical protein